jgi:tyrosyl-tRNA synthetase
LTAENRGVRCWYRAAAEPRCRIMALRRSHSPWDRWQACKSVGDAKMDRVSEILTGLSVEELEALADSLLAPAAQARLDELLARRKETPLSAQEETMLDSLLQKTDQLTILKTRARYTLNQAKTEVLGT